MNRVVWLDPCPDSVWEQLPGGPVAEDETFGQVWHYMGSVVPEGEPVRHEFRHRSHPTFGGARVYAHVADGDAGPRLSRLFANGRELALDGDDPEAT